MSEPIPTGCGSLDQLLGGGFERGTVTQVYGPPASGKSNVALSAAIEVAAGGDAALYVDTEGLSVDRFQQLATARAARATDGGTSEADAAPSTDAPAAGGDDPLAAGADLDASSDLEPADGAGEADADAVSALASRIIITDALDFDEQREAVRDAAELAPEVDLIVLDSATGFYRLERDDEDAGETLRAVGRQVTHLLSLARRYDLAVVITNQVYADPESDSSRPRPLGGHTLTHWSGAVVRLERFRGGNRRATLEKHRSLPAGETARFRITGSGIESVDDGSV